jgi:hypothetical protein
MPNGKSLRQRHFSHTGVAPVLCATKIGNRQLPPCFWREKLIMARRKPAMTITFEGDRDMRDELRALARADARRSVSSVIRAAVIEYLAKYRQSRERPKAAA